MHSSSQFDTSAKKCIGLVKFLFVYSTSSVLHWPFECVCNGCGSLILCVFFSVLFPCRVLLALLHSKESTFSNSSSSFTLCTCSAYYQYSCSKTTLCTSSVYYQQQRWQQINQNYARCMGQHYCLLAGQMSAQLLNALALALPEHMLVSPELCLLGAPH